jgi:hypothetical protein
MNTTQANLVNRAGETCLETDTSLAHIRHAIDSIGSEPRVRDLTVLSVSRLLLAPIPFHRQPRTRGVSYPTAPPAVAHRATAPAAHTEERLFFDQL